MLYAHAVYRTATFVFSVCPVRQLYMSLYAVCVVENVAVLPPVHKEHIVVEGQSYTIPCGTRVDADVRWFYESWEVYFQGRIWGHFQSRFSLNTSVPLLYGLDISNVWLNDSGNYACIDEYGQGVEHVHDLVVQGKLRHLWL